MTTDKKTRTPKKNSLPRGWLFIIGLLVVAGIAGVYIFSQNQAQPTAQITQNKTRSLGLENAPITIVEFADFNCSTCKTWQLRGIKEQILLEYSDKVRFVWRDFPVITAQSPKAAEAGWCANDQGGFWKYHDLLYFMAPITSTEDLKAYAAQASLDMQKFNQCLDSGQHQADVQIDWQEALSHGFRGTPSFLINGEPLFGPPSYGQLVSIIEEILAGKS